MQVQADSGDSPELAYFNFCHSPRRRGIQ